MSSRVLTVLLMVSLLVFAGSSLFATCLRACSCAKFDADAWLEASDALFEGEVIDEDRVTFLVITAWKGVQEREQVSVNVLGVGGSCGDARFVVGQTWILSTTRSDGTAAFGGIPAGDFTSGPACSFSSTRTDYDEVHDELDSAVAGAGEGCTCAAFGSGPGPMFLVWVLPCGCLRRRRGRGPPTRLP